jgi:excisionase family DNA binding protein
MTTFLTLRSVAETLGIHPNTVRKLVRSGQLRSYRVGSQHRFDTRDFEAYLSSIYSTTTKKEA